MSNAAKVGSRPTFQVRPTGPLVGLVLIDRCVVNSRIRSRGSAFCTTFDLRLAALQIFAERVAQAVMAIGAVIRHD
jgi:hypothetical protein